MRRANFTTSLRKSLGLAMPAGFRSEEHTSELQSLMRISYAGFCLKKKKSITFLPSLIIVHSSFNSLIPITYIYFVSSSIILYSTYIIFFIIFYFLLCYHLI